MSGRVRNKVGLIAAVAAAIAVMVPATLALGDEDPVVTGESSVVLLTLGAVDEITWESSTQSLILRNNCSVNGAGGPLLSLEGIPGALGQNKDGLGVRTGGSRGEPCGRTEADNGEAISVKLASGLSDYLMTAVDLDLELKFNAKISVSYRLGGGQVATHMFDPTSGSDDGPDSKDGDNYRYIHRPGTEEVPVFFDEVVLTPTSGSFSLEGGADLSDNLAECDDGDEDGIYPCGTLDENLNTSSQFEVVKTFDGEIDCGQPPTPLGDENVSGDVTMHSQSPVSDAETNGWIVTNCTKKPFNTDVTINSISFMPVDEDLVARYTFDVTVNNQLITTDGAGLITSLKAIYNEDGDLTFPDGGDGVEACNGTPLLVDDPDPGTVYEDYWTTSTLYVPGTTDPIMPTGESVCFYSASVSPTGLVGTDLFGTEEWSFLIFADPGIGFR